VKDEDFLEDGDASDEAGEIAARQSLDEEWVNHQQYSGRNVTLREKTKVSGEKPSKVTDGPTPNNIAAHRWWVPLLKGGEEADLLRDAKAGSKAAADKLFQHHHGAILDIANSYFGPPFEVLMGAGAEGFLEAIKGFNLRRNSNQLWAYAQFHVRRRMLEAVYDWCKHGAAGETRIEKWVRISAPKWPYSHEGRQLTAADVVEALDCDRGKAELAMQRHKALAYAPDLYNVAEVGHSDEEDGDWPSETEIVAEDKVVVECDRGGGKITDADWALIQEGRARPSGLPGRGRNPQPPEPLKPISREVYEEDQRQAYRASEAKAAQYRLGVSYLRSKKVNPKRHRPLARLVLHDMNPHRNGRAERGLLDHMAKESDLRAKRRLANGRQQYAQSLVDKPKIVQATVPTVAASTYSTSVNSAYNSSLPVDWDKDKPFWPEGSKWHRRPDEQKDIKPKLRLIQGDKNGKFNQPGALNNVVHGRAVYQLNGSDQRGIRQGYRATGQSSA
jgi:hypothetical protein